MLLHRSLTLLNSNRGIADRFLDELLSLYKSSMQSTTSSTFSLSSASPLTQSTCSQQLQQQRQKCTLQRNDSRQKLTHVQRLLQQLLRDKPLNSENKTHTQLSGSGVNKKDTQTSTQDGSTHHMSKTVSFVKRLMQANPHVSFQQVLLRWKATVNHPRSSAMVLPHTPLAEAQLLNQKINQLDQFAVLKGPQKVQDVNALLSSKPWQTSVNVNDNEQVQQTSSQNWQREQHEYHHAARKVATTTITEENNNYICMWEVLRYYSAAHFAAELGDKQLFDFCKNELHDGVPFFMRNEEAKQRTKFGKKSKDVCQLWPIPSSSQSSSSQSSSSQSSSPQYSYKVHQHQRQQNKQQQQEQQQLSQLYSLMTSQNKSANASQQVHKDRSNAQVTHDIFIAPSHNQKSQALTQQVSKAKSTNHRQVYGLVAFDLLATHGFDYNGAYLSHYAAQSGQIDIMHELIISYGAPLILREQTWQRPITIKLIWGPPSHLIGLSSAACAIAFGQLQLLQWLQTHYTLYLNRLPRHELHHALLALGMRMDEEESGHALLDFLWNHHLLVPTSATVISHSLHTNNSPSSSYQQSSCQQKYNERQQACNNNMLKKSKAKFVFNNKGKLSLTELCEGKEAIAMLFAAAQSGNYVVTNWFVKTFGEQVLWMPSRGESTYLHHSARGGNVKLLRHLLCERRCTDCPSLHNWIDVPDNEQRTPAVWAVIGGRRGGVIVETLSLLLQCGSHWKTYRDIHGCNLYEIAKQHHSPFSKLCRYLRKEVVK